LKAVEAQRKKAAPESLHAQLRGGGTRLPFNKASA
jgi:hypothetical protein